MLRKVTNASHSVVVPLLAVASLFSALPCQREKDDDEHFVVKSSLVPHLFHFPFIVGM